MKNFLDWVKDNNLELPTLSEDRYRNYGKCTYPANTKQLDIEVPPLYLAAKNPDILAKMNQGKCTGIKKKKKKKNKTKK